MSERGSFVTEYIYCDECLKRVAAVLCQDRKDLRGIQIPAYTGLDHPLPIIAGKIGGGYAGAEAIMFQFDLFNADNAPCHDVRVAVLADNQENKVFIIHPSGGVDEVL